MLPAPVRRAADLALEVAVVPSFTRIGPRVRRAVDGWEAPAADALAGRTVVVTGATSGLGAAIARGVGAAGADVVVVGRDAARGATTCEAVVAAGGTARFVAADVDELAQVRRLADDLVDAPLHAIVHNAGAILPERRTTSEGLEATWASMVVGPHLLTRLLAAHTDRTIWMSSGGMYLQALDLADWSWERRPWDGTRAYAQAKRAQVDLVALATERAELPPQVAMHPGWADTPGVADSLPGFHRAMGTLLRTPAEGADTAVWLCAAPSTALQPGRLYLDRRPRSTVRWPGTGTSTEDRRHLRLLVDEQAGLTGDAAT